MIIPKCNIILKITKTMSNTRNQLGKPKTNPKKLVAFLEILLKNPVKQWLLNLQKNWPRKVKINPKKLKRQKNQKMNYSVHLAKLLQKEKKVDGLLNLPKHWQRKAKINPK